MGDDNINENDDAHGDRVEKISDVIIDDDICISDAENMRIQL